MAENINENIFSPTDGNHEVQQTSANLTEHLALKCGISKAESVSPALTGKVSTEFGGTPKGARVLLVC